ncbi:MAG: hypothetical protein ACI8S6_002471 [Myxococcota bacterium]|jgi:hypothetical protein
MSDRLTQQIAGIRRLLQSTDHPLTAVVYSLSEQASFLLYLLEKEPDLEPCKPDLSALQSEVSVALLQAEEEDPAIRLDETWGNTGGLLDWLSKLTGRPWRPVEPDSSVVLADAAQILTTGSWSERIVALEAHPILNDYYRMSEHQRAWAEDDSEATRAHMVALRGAFTPRKATLAADGAAGSCEGLVSIVRLTAERRARTPDWRNRPLLLGAGETTFQRQPSRGRHDH